MPAGGSRGGYGALVQEIEGDTGRMRVLVDIVAGTSAGGLDGAACLAFASHSL